MARLILFGGGDGGGIWIGPNGIKPIPPFDPRIRTQLRGLALLLRGQASITGNLQRDVETVTTKVSHALVNDLQEVAGVGSLEGESSVVYLDADDGFTCGSTGKPYHFPPKGVGPVPHADPRVAMTERATIR